MTRVLHTARISKTYYAYYFYLGYLYKRRLAIEVFKVKPFFNFIESKRRGVLLEEKRKKTELGRNSFSCRGTVVWNSLDRTTWNLEKLDAL